MSAQLKTQRETSTRGRGIQIGIGLVLAEEVLRRDSLFAMSLGEEERGGKK